MLVGAASLNTDEHWGTALINSPDPAWLPDAPAHISALGEFPGSNEKHALNSTRVQPTGDQRVNVIALEGCKAISQHSWSLPVQSQAGELGRPRKAVPGH